MLTFLSSKLSSFVKFLHLVSTDKISKGRVFNWSGIVTTCNLQHWKEALATIVTYTSGQEQMDLCDQLGKRLEADGKPENLINACVCYICSANLDNLVNCWQKCLGSDETDTSESLQDLVEKIMVLKYCFKNYHPELSMQLENAQSMHKLNSKLVKYAKLLADQGCFLNAYSYLNDSNDGSIMAMKDRIYHVLDPMVIQQFKLRKPDNPFKPVHHQPASKRNSFGQPSQSTANRSTNIFAPTSSSVPQYPSAGQFNNMAPVNHPMPISNLYPPQDLTKRSTTPNFNKSLYTSAIPSVPVTANMAPMSSKTTEQSHNTGQSFYTPSRVPTQPQVPQNPPLLSYMNNRPTTGWNDPPMVAPKIKNTVVNQTDKPAFFQPSEPSSMPLMNQSLPNNPLQMFQPPSASNSQFQPQQSFQPQLVQAQQTFQPQPVQPQIQQIQAKISQPEKPVEKGPIPSEHSELQFVFDSLLSKTQAMSSNATTKRKLEDVGRKLEVLYDRLRDSSLSPNVVQSLHSMIQCLKVNDFVSSLQMHSQIVATSNFSEISGFMPGIKVLIQTCQQMNLTL